jgi:two-component system, cell cycle response regulator CtrA
MRILLVENICSVATSHISDDLFLVACAEDADEALSLLQHEYYDLVLLNMGAQPTDGFDLIRRMRASGNDTPVLALTGPWVDDKTEALRLGADEALTEPVDPAALRVRIKAVLRHRRSVRQSLLWLGDLSLCLTLREVRFGNKLIRLSPKEFAMLELMVLRKGTILTKATFLNHLYIGADEETEARLIDVSICKLRKKLRRAGAGDLICIVWGHGYIIRDPAPGIRVDFGNTGDLRPIQARLDVAFNTDVLQAS